MLATFQCFLICYICIIHICCICNAFTHTYIAIHTDTCLLCYFCVLWLFTFAFSRFGRSSQSERSWCCYRLDSWIQQLIKTQFCKYPRNSAMNPFRKCFILSCCWLQDGVIKVNTFFKSSPVKSVPSLSNVNSALTCSGTRNQSHTTKSS